MQMQALTRNPEQPDKDMNLLQTCTVSNDPLVTYTPDLQRNMSENGGIEVEYVCVCVC